MNIETEKNRLACLRQDFAVLRETLGASGVRRVNADLIDVSIVFLFALILRDSSGLIFFMWGRDSVFLKTIGYDFQTGQTVADRLAGTHLIQPRDVDSLAIMAEKIETLQHLIESKDNSRMIRN